jgi:hypothetical protein
MATTHVLSTVLSLALAQQTTLTLPFFGYDGDSFVASVVSAQSDATVFALACPPESAGCGLFPYQTLTYGPSTYKMDMSFPGDGVFTMTQDCVLASSSAVCKESASGSEANDPGSSTATYEGSDEGNVPVTVTAGGDKLGTSAKPTPTPTSGGSSQRASAGSAAQGTGARVTSIPPASAAAASTSPTGNAALQVVAIQGHVVVAAAAGLFAGLL